MYASTRFLPFLCAAAIALVGACSDDPNAGGDGPLRCPTGEQEVRGVCVPIEDTGSRDTTAPDTEDDTTVEDTAPDTPIETDTGDCVTGQLRCNETGVPEECLSGVWVAQAACAANEVCVAGRCALGTDCTPGEVLGCNSETERRVCNDAGTAFEPDPCDEGLFCFRGECGTQICEPGATSCTEEGRYILTCAPSGEERIRSGECNPRDDLVCVGGECVSGCTAALKNPAYIGCEYWSVDLPQYDDPFSDARGTRHAVVVANTGTRPADVTVETRSGIPLIDELVRVEPGTVETVLFPVANVEATTRSLNSFRISTTEPVVAYQFNPLNNADVASNDASLLLPANAIGREYYVLSWPSGIGAMGFEPQNGWFTVVAVREGETNVTITFSANVIDGTDEDLRGISAGTTRTFTMQQYEVLNFEGNSAMFDIADLTGSHVVADRAVVVFGGHSQAVMGEDEDGGGPCCADHLEEQLFPVSTWGTRYPAVHSPPRGTEPDIWRVIAARDGTRLTTVPPISGLDGVQLNAGEWVEAEVVESFEIVGSNPILVAHYLVSQQDARIPRTKGDPSMILAVASEQFRTEYSILVPETYSEDWVTVIRPIGAEITLDGTPLTDTFTPFGSNEFEYAHVAVEAGPHEFVAPNEDRFGIAAYGYNNAVSYGYPGGLNLATEFDFVDP